MYVDYFMVEIPLVGFKHQNPLSHGFSGLDEETGFWTPTPPPPKNKRVGSGGGGSVFSKSSDLGLPLGKKESKTLVCGGFGVYILYILCTNKPKNGAN